MKLTNDVFSKRSYGEGADEARNRREVGACLVAAEKLGIKVEFGPWWGLHAMHINPEKLTLQEKRLLVRKAKSISEEEVRQFWEKLEEVLFPEQED
jgi:hypothetical protein